MTPEPQRVPPGLSHDGLRSLGVGAISYVEACAALHGRGTVEAPRIFPVRLQWKAADAKYAKAPVCGPAPGWRSADNAWQPGVPVPPRATHFGAVPSDFGLAVLDEDNDRLDDLLRIVEAAGVEYATVPTAAGWHVVIRWDYSAWGELRNANWTAGGAAGQIRGGNGWVTLWAPAALVDALPALALSDKAPALVAALKRPALPAGQRHDEGNRFVYHDPTKRDEGVLWFIKSGYSRTDAVRHADAAARDGERDGNTGGAERADFDAASPVSVSKALPITAKFVVEHGAWRLWVANPPGYVDVDARMIEREVNDFVYAQHRAGKIDAKTKAQLDRGAATRDVVDALEKRSDVFSSQAEWDAVPDLLRLRDGRILNVATGELREATPADLLSRSLGATLPSAEMSDTALRAAAAPLFDFAATGLDGDAAAVEWFLLTFPRYVIRGNRAKRTNAYVHSTQGNTGKSTAGHAYCALLGDYAEPLNVSDLDDKAHETWKLRLMGARFCYVDDMEQRSLASDFRRAVSGEVLKARPLYSNKAVSFQSQAAFLFTSNVRLRTSHRGTLSRLQIVPWSETAIADVDEAYRARLVAPEVLDAWLALILRHDADVRDIPARLRAAQDDYETESDTLIELARDAGCAEGDGEIEDTAFLAKLAEAQLVPRNVASPLRWVRALVREHPRVELVTRRARATEPRRYYVVGLVPLDGDAGGASDGAACSADMPF